MTVKVAVIDTEHIELYLNVQLNDLFNVLGARNMNWGGEI